MLSTNTRRSRMAAVEKTVETVVETVVETAVLAAVLTAASTAVSATLANLPTVPGEPPTALGKLPTTL